MKPYDFKWTKFYESNADFLYNGLLIDLTRDERVICSTVIDTNNYSVLTTQRLITKLDGRENTGNIEGAIDKQYGDFKGNAANQFTLGKVQLEDGTDLGYFIEIGKASMVMIHGIRTLLRKQKSNI